MKRTKSLLGTLSVTTLLVVGLACGSQGASPSGGGEDLVTPPLGQQTLSDSSGATQGSMIPRARDVNDLVARSAVIFVGTVDSVIEEKMMGGYGEDGKLLPAGEDGLPVTDYSVRVLEILKNDSGLSEEGVITLRMFGHQNPKTPVITSVSFDLPNPGDHVLFALGGNPDGTYGSGPEGLIAIDESVVSYTDGVPFAEELSPDLLKSKIRDAAASGS